MDDNNTVSAISLLEAVESTEPMRGEIVTSVVLLSVGGVEEPKDRELSELEGDGTGVLMKDVVSVLVVS